MGELYWAAELSLLELIQRMVPVWLLLLSSLLTRLDPEDNKGHRMTAGLQGDAGCDHHPRRPGAHCSVLS